MNKHILTYTEKINESIGRGSVLLIKGKSMKSGRFLYVTTINGYVEIKPGIKMVFLSDVIYRVIHKGGDKFSGRKIDYKNEEGLKGVFNMKTPGKPSVVLNHNKTPFHWETLKHTDIGTALRSLGPRLFTHEMILENLKEPDTVKKSAGIYLMGEVFKAFNGEESAIRIIKVDEEDGKRFEDSLWDVEPDDDELPSITRRTMNDYEWMLYVDIIIPDESKVPDEFVDYFKKLGAFFNLDFMSTDDKEMMGVSEKGISIYFDLKTDITFSVDIDRGNDVTPESYDLDIEDVETELIDGFVINNEYEINIDDSFKAEYDIFTKYISTSTPMEVVEKVKWRKYQSGGN